jgi:tRNA(Ile)-lysidine synthetase-like protein
MHLVRGTGLKGLGGITPQRGKIIRPMLSVTRHQVLDFLQEYHIPYREDSSNHSDQFLRNRLRHHVMPLLKDENPRLAENLSAMALRLREDEEALIALSGNDEFPEVPKLRQMPSALRNRVLERFLKKHGISEPEAEHIALANALVFSEKPSASATFPGGVQIGRCYDQLICCDSEQLPETVQLSCPGEVRFGKFRIVCTPAESVINGQRFFTINGGTDITVRSRRSGDRLTHSGGTGTVKKLMIDRKIPAHRRSFLPVLEDELGIVAVCDLGAQLNRRADGLPGWKITITELE